ncbi:porin family protein [Solitalea koreensis]|uniref:Outer membrane protein beta-barrel domain-containing protein n=1 Tax=Solitalea koreensis TaxID=543615 RepID=A0A521AYE2_9SPHI|nr:porin family protein [Solitalea koreensis]SMO39836.1 Outer membrane protein beta-barrel domain-containing protein [Solitalea koreensis]
MKKPHELYSPTGLKVRGGFLTAIKKQNMFRKKGLLTMAVLLGFGGTLKAQQSSVGIKAGLNLSKVSTFTSNNGSTETNATTDYKPGFHAGIYADLGISSILSFQPELQYSQKGYRSTYSVLGNVREISARYSYLDIPLLAKIKPQGTQGGFNLFAGPTVSFLLTQKYTETGKDFTVTSEDREINKDNFRKSDVGVVLGAGYDFGVFNLNAAYNFGLQKLDKYNNDVKARNQTMQVSIGAKF